MIRTRVSCALVALIVALLGVTTLTLAPASAAPRDYFNSVASKLKANPVYVDPKASPTITPQQTTQLTNQVRAAKVKLFIVVTDNAQIGNTPGRDLPRSIKDALRQDGVYGVLSKDGFFAQSYGMHPEIQDATDDVADKVIADSKRARGGKADSFEVLTNFVRGMDAVKVTDARPVTGAAPAAAPAKSGPNKLVIGLIILGVVLLVIAMAIVLFLVSRKRKPQPSQSGSNTTAAHGFTSSTSRPTPPAYPGSSGTPRPSSDRSRRSSRSSTHDNYYPGGHVGGTYYQPGWYPVVFWPADTTPASGHTAYTEPTPPASPSSYQGGHGTGPSDVGGGSLSGTTHDPSPSTTHDPSPGGYDTGPSDVGGGNMG